MYAAMADLKPKINVIRILLTDRQTDRKTGRNRQTGRQAAGRQ